MTPTKLKEYLIAYRNQNSQHKVSAVYFLGLNDLFNSFQNYDQGQRKNSSDRELQVL